MDGVKLWSLVCVLRRFNRGCSSLREEDSATLISEALRKKFTLKDEDIAGAPRM